MDFLMNMLRWIASLRNPVLDAIFSLITHLGEETVFLALAICIFWCVNKREGYFILITGLIGTVMNQALKMIFRIPRPWVIDPEFKVVDSAIEEATGYSFPSGHTQNIAGTFGAIAAFNRRRTVTVVCVIIILLVSFSRLYLGVHTLLDVGVSLVLAFLLVALLRPAFSSDERFHKFMPVISVVGVLLTVAHFVFIIVISSDTTLDPTNLASSVKNASTLLGATAGLIPVYYADRRFIRFETTAPWYSQVMKLVLGLGGVLLIKSGLSTPLTLLFGNEYVARAVRYFLVVLFAGIVWPLTFRRFASLRIAALDSFGKRASSFLSRTK